MSIRTNNEEASGYYLLFSKSGVFVDDPIDMSIFDRWKKAFAYFRDWTHWPMGQTDSYIFVTLSMNHGVC